MGVNVIRLFVDVGESSGVSLVNPQRKYCKIPDYLLREFRIYFGAVVFHSLNTCD